MSSIFNLNLTPKTTYIKNKRLNLIDEIRGIATVLMVVYHLFYSANFLFHLEWGRRAYLASVPVEPFIAITFIFLSGFCCHISHNNLVRGIRLFIIAIAITLLTVFFTPGNEIYFGILHFLSISMIIYAIIKRSIDKIPAMYLPVCAATCFVLYLILWGVPHKYLGINFLRLRQTLPESLYTNYYTAFLGFPQQKFFSADYFPLLPNICLFFSGVFLGHLSRLKGYPNFIKPLRIRSLAFIGRHSLLIYIIHQPLIITVLYLTTMLK